MAPPSWRRALRPLRRLARRLLPASIVGGARQFLPVHWQYRGAFARAALRAMGVRRWRRLTPLARTYVEFALSTNERGNWAAEAIRRFREVRGARCLDVGCAYGGFLVALHRLGARQVVGIDVDSRLLELARVNLDEHRTPGELLRLDVETPAVVDAIGQFDIVVANDVLEHVRDLRRSIANLSHLVAPGGLLFVVIPNKYFVRYLLADGHYRLPGLTLLSRRDAESYYRSARVGAEPYGVGHFRTYGYYRRALQKTGLAVQLFDSGLGVYDLAQLTGEFERAGAFFERFDAPDVPRPIAAKIVRRARIVHGTFRHLMSEYDGLRNGRPEEAKSLARRIVVRYGMEAWCLIGRKAGMPTPLS